ncbi:hypothetical protein QE152_g24673 [Popillia japonica]|uniref:Gag-like protein n=1 Tax=Popillia japonica TaxID=7064 RepID=A0AAW1K3W5_POPJA
MRRNRGGRPMPLVLVKISKQQKRIYHLKEIMSLDIPVKALKSKPSIEQCSRCQRYGHAQSRCTAQRNAWRVAKIMPPKSANVLRPPTGANCGDKHPVNYRGCSCFPKPKPMVASARTPKKQTPVSSQIRPAKSYSHVAACTWTQSQIQKKSETPKTAEKAKKAKTPPKSPRYVLQAMTQQINMLPNTLIATFPSENLKDRK